MGSSYMCFNSITKEAVLLTYFCSKHSLSASSIQQQSQIEPKCNTYTNSSPQSGTFLSKIVDADMQRVPVT